MSLLRKPLLWLSDRRGLKELLLRFPPSRRMAARFVAGDHLADALDATRELNAEGFRVTLDQLGESVSDRREARAATDRYLESLEVIATSPARSTISLKLTQLGLDIDPDFCRSNLREIVGRAAELDNFVRIDMESSRHTASTLDVFRSVFAEHTNVGIVIQAYLRRSERDVRELVELGAPVRLCKGAYDEPPSVAFRDREEVDRSYVRLMRLLLDGGVPAAIATHDERMIEATLEHVRREGVAGDAFEFQMLYGVRRDYQREILRAGHAMRIYVPYGPEWYAYFMRRMAERPQNLWFVLRASMGS